MFIGVQLINHVLLVSAAQQSESVVLIHILTPFRSLSRLGHKRALSRIP